MAEEVVINLVPETEPPPVDKGYYCIQCGNPLDDGRKKLCNACKATKPVKVTRPYNKKGHSSTAKQSLSTAKASQTFAKLLVIITAIFAWYFLRTKGIPDSNGDLAESLAMTDDEALPIARVLGRLIATNESAAKVVAPLVENEDLLDAAFAIWEYTRRVNRIIEQMVPTEARVMQERGNNVSNEAFEESRGTVDVGSIVAGNFATV